MLHLYLLLFVSFEQVPLEHNAFYFIDQQTIDFYGVFSHSVSIISSKLSNFYLCSF